MTETATAGTGIPTAGATDGDGGGVRAAAHDVTEQARSLAETGMHDAATVIDEVRSQTANLIGEAGHRARERADSQVGNAARMLGEMSDELDRMASASSGGSPVSSLARDGATAMRSISRRLDEGGLDAAMQDVRGFARRRPAVFLTGAFAVGMLAGRLVRNVDVRAVADGAHAGDAGDQMMTGTTARLEGGMGQAVDPEQWAGSAASTGAGDLTAGVEADWDAPAMRQPSGRQA